MGDILTTSQYLEEKQRDLEHAVLAGLLNTEGRQPQWERLKAFAEHGGAGLFSGDHAAVAAAIEELYNAGAAVDSMTVGDAMRRRGMEDARNDPYPDVDRSSFLFSLGFEGITKAVHFDWYLSELVNLARRRNLQTALLDACGEFSDYTKSADDILEHVKSAVTAAEKPKNDGLYCPFQNPIKDALRGRCDGLYYLNNYPPSYNWMLKGSLRRDSLGVIAGPPGAGKGTLAIQWCVAAAAGTKWVDTWEVTEPCRALYVSAEDDSAIIHRRLHHALKQLPEGMQHAAAERITALPVTGHCELFKIEGESVAQTRNYAELEYLLRVTDAELVILDTLARFFLIEEVDNTKMTECCAFMEELCRKHHCNIILLHHTNKAAGDCINDKADLDKALSQTAIRGASALLGCVRWAMIAVPLGRDLAKARLGTIADNTVEGAFVAVRVSKKNVGRTEARHFFGRDAHGLLFPVEEWGPEAKAEASVEQDAEELTAAIEDRAAQGLPPVSKSRGGCELLGWGKSRAEKATAYALQSGMIVERAKDKGKGTVLMPVTEEAPEAENAEPEQAFLPGITDAKNNVPGGRDIQDFPQCPECPECPDNAGTLKKVI